MLIYNLLCRRIIIKHLMYDDPDLLDTAYTG